MEGMLAKQYMEAALKHGAATDEGDHKAANRAFKELVKATKALRNLPDRGEQILIGMLGQENPYVVCASATHLLPINSDLALKALGKIATANKGLCSMNAQMVIREWEAGRLVID